MDHEQTQDMKMAVGDLTDSWELMGGSRLFKVQVCCAGQVCLPSFQISTRDKHTLCTKIKTLITNLISKGVEFVVTVLVPEPRSGGREVAELPHLSSEGEVRGQKGQFLITGTDTIQEPVAIETSVLPEPRDMFFREKKVLCSIQHCSLQQYRGYAHISA